MAEISEQKETTNYLLVWGLGLAVIAVAVGISWGVFATMHQNVNAGAGQLNSGIKNAQQQGSGITNSTL